MPQRLSKNNGPIKASWWHALLKVTSQEDVDLPLDMDMLYKAGEPPSSLL